MKEVERLISAINKLRRKSRLTTVQQRKLNDARRELAMALSRLTS